MPKSSSCSALRISFRTVDVRVLRDVMKRRKDDRALWVFAAQLLDPSREHQRNFLQVGPALVGPRLPADRQALVEELLQHAAGHGAQRFASRQPDRVATHLVANDAGPAQAGVEQATQAPGQSGPALDRCQRRRAATRPVAGASDVAAICARGAASAGRWSTTTSGHAPAVRTAMTEPWRGSRWGNSWGTSVPSTMR